LEVRLEENRPLGRPRSRREEKIKMIFKQWDGEPWTEMIGLRIGTGGGRL